MSAASWPAAAALAAAAVSGAVLLRGRWTRALGPSGAALAPAFLLLAWLCLLALGRETGSVSGMAWTAALPLSAAALSSKRRARPARAARLWTPLDWGAFALLAALILLEPGYDLACHQAVSAALLRGNVPPSALNDPRAPLLYHWLLDAAGAVVVQATGASVETALRCACVVCVAAVISALRAVSGALFRGRLTRQAARLFFLFGFGPLWLAGPAPGWPPFHGATTQSFAESILRRPMCLDYVLFVFLLGALLPRLGPRPARKPCPLLLLLPAAYVLPLASEELALFALALTLLLALKRRAGFSELAAWWLALGAGAAGSGVLRAVGSAAARAPHPAFLWPPSLPVWRPQPGALPLFSAGAGRTLLLEWGPVFFAALAAAVFFPRRRVLVWLFAAGFLAACLFSLGPWRKADLDRFLFYGTCSGFMLAASGVERFERAGRARRAAAAAAVLALLVMPGPLLFAAWQIRHGGLSRPRWPIGELAPLFSRVRPREQVLTDAASFQALTLLGVVTAGPMEESSIGVADAARLPGYLESHRGLRPDWLFLPCGDPRLAGAAPEARLKGYCLERNARSVGQLLDRASRKRHNPVTP